MAELGSRRVIIDEAAATRWALLACAASSAVLLAYFLLRYLLGPLDVDEIYFSHTMWLTLQGKAQYVDFFSQHFPTYFQLYRLILPAADPANLDFVWIMRFSGLAVLATYIIVLFRVEPEKAPYLLPLLLTFVVVSRMIEIRTDTFGLLLLNIGWSIILLRYSRARMMVGALFATAGALFSARGLAMAGGFALALVWASSFRRDWRSVGYLIAFGALLFAAAILFYLAAPSYVLLLFRSTLIDPSQLLARLTFEQRMLAFDRLPQVALTIVALATCLTTCAKRIEPGRSGIIAIACLSQLLLILLDPSPFPYVYAWAAIPVLVGLGMVRSATGADERIVLAALGTSFAMGITAFVIGYPLLKGQQPPTGSNYRVLLDAPLEAARLRRTSLDQLVKLMIAGPGQHSLYNQLAVRSEVCKRTRGTVLSVWQSHPICMSDASYYWYELKWPNIWADASPSGGDEWFSEIFRVHPPALFIFRVPGAVHPLGKWMDGSLSDYRLDSSGFAIRETVNAGGDNSGRESSLQSNGHS